VKRIERICGLLEQAYGSPRLGNKDDPLDELVFIMLSQMTTGPSYTRVFDRLRASCRTWDDLARFRTSRLSRLIADAGFGPTRAVRIKAIADALIAQFGRVSLDHLRGLSTPEAEDFLTSLPGVGIKTAKCVLMYSLGHAVLPVDTHVARISTRLGFLRPVDRSSRAMHSRLEDLVPPTRRYGYHVNVVSHGRAVCKATSPQCNACVIQRHCPTGKALAR
jgi:endonuclease III